MLALIHSASASVSIHAPRVGCDVWLSNCLGLTRPFQFTHPVWGATTRLDFSQLRAKFQFTHPVWGATLSTAPWIVSLRRFNSRTPCGVRLQGKRNEWIALHVSIHAPRVGCDPYGVARFGGLRAVSIHAPRVGCDSRRTRPSSRSQFQFTHPVWGATSAEGKQLALRYVSIHAPRVGCDSPACADW